MNLNIDIKNDCLQIRLMYLIHVRQQITCLAAESPEACKLVNRHSFLCGVILVGVTPMSRVYCYVKEGHWDTV